MDDAPVNSLSKHIDVIGWSKEAISVTQMIKSCFVHVVETRRLVRCFRHCVVVDGHYYSISIYLSNTVIPCFFAVIHACSGLHVRPPEGRHIETLALASN